MELGLFLITWFTDPPTRFFRIWKKRKKYTYFFNLLFFFLQIFSCRSQAQIKEEGKRLGRPALKPLANKLWSLVQNQREELEPTDPVQGLIPSVNDTEIRKQQLLPKIYPRWLPLGLVILLRAQFRLQRWTETRHMDQMIY